MRDLPAKRGFTLIEIMVVLSISMVLVSMGLVAYGRINKRKQVEVAASNLAVFLRQVQADSYSAKIDEISCEGIFQGMSLQVTAGTNEYARYMSCSVSGESMVGQVDTVGRGVEFALVGGATRADYLPLGRGLSGAVSFRVVHENDADLCQQVNVLQTGRVEIVEIDGVCEL